MFHINFGNIEKFFAESRGAEKEPAVRASHLLNEYSPDNLGLWSENQFDEREIILVITVAAKTGHGFTKLLLF